MKYAKPFVLMALTAVAVVWAGGLYLEIGNPSASAEAKGLNALLTARVTACTDPAKSVITASVVESSQGEMRRTELKVVPLKTVGMFAVIGNAPKGSVIDLGVTNPEYKNYQPRVLIRSDAQGVQWASAKRFFSTPPVDADFKSYFLKSE